MMVSAILIVISSKLLLSSNKKQVSIEDFFLISTQKSRTKVLIIKFTTETRLPCVLMVILRRVFHHIMLK